MARRIARTATQERVPTQGNGASPKTDVRPRQNGDGTERPAAEARRRSGPTREQIAARAYELYLARGGEHGYDEQDWLKAEQELDVTDPSIMLPTEARRSR